MINAELKNYQGESDEVLYTQRLITTITREDIKILSRMAKRTKRKRIRICAHPSKDSAVHDMLIVHFRDTYIRPHKHVSREESIHVISGEMQLVVFCDDGSIDTVIYMGEYGGNGAFFYRMSDSKYHTLVPLSDIVVFHECTQGPFRRSDTIYPEWCPKEEEVPLVDVFMNNLRKAIQDVPLNKDY